LSVEKRKRLILSVFLKEVFVKKLGAIHCSFFVLFSMLKKV